MTENHAQPSPANPDDVVNPLLLQAFAWDLPADSTHWRLLADNAALLADCGVSSVWLPPAYKGQAGVEDVGYGVYDTYDLGEFDQKGTVPTKYGTKEDYLAAIEALHAAGISVVADIVLNHRMGGDDTEVVRATPVDPHDRTRTIGETEEITAWTRYTFPGRAGAYSDFTWDWTCFHGTDWDEARHQQGVWLFEGTLVAADPARAVTFVENHDTQPGQSLASTIESWFKPSAYALILLREAGTPCVFWGDLFGTPETGDLPAVTELPLLMTMRRALAHGPQHDALDDPDVVGFAREGDEAHPGSGLAVVLSDRRAATKRLHVGARHAGEQWICVLGGHEPVTIGDDGNVELPVSDGGLSVYAPEAARLILDSAEQHLLRQR